MEENQNPSPQPPVENPAIVKNEHKPSGLKSKWPFLVIALLLVLLGVFGGYFVLNQTNKSAVAPTPTPQDNGKACTQEAKICPDGSSVGRTGPNCEFEACPATSPASAKLESFTSAKFPDLSFKEYTLMYPSDWTLSEKRDESTSISTVTLTKDGYSLKIFQAATGGAGCIYEGQMPEGPASDYRNNEYKDLETSFATLRQTESPSGGKMSYVYCQESSSDNSFGQPTSVGHMSATTQAASPDSEIIGELEEIVKSIKTL